MKLMVGIKHVPDTESKINVSPDGLSIDESGIKWVISPFDEYALEEALKIREAGEGEVLLACLGRESAQTSIKQGLAMGADRAIHVADERYDQADALTRARALAAVAQKESVDLFLVGKSGVGSDEGLTGPMLAELLGWPHVAGITTLEMRSDGFTASRAFEGGTEIHEGGLPAVLTCEKGLNEPRYPSLKGIMQAKKKKTDKLTVDELGIDSAELEAGSRVVYEKLEVPPPRSSGRILKGSTDECATELARVLREEAKVI